MYLWYKNKLLSLSSFIVRFSVCGKFNDLLLTTEKFTVNQ